jgi:hypothetical protein
MARNKEKRLFSGAFLPENKRKPGWFFNSSMTVCLFACQQAPVFHGVLGTFANPAEGAFEPVFDLDEDRVRRIDFGLGRFFQLQFGVQGGVQVGQFVYRLQVHVCFSFVFAALILPDRCHRSVIALVNIGFFPLLFRYS